MATTPKCNNGWTICPCAPTSCSKYDGPTLPNSGVTSGDNLSVVLQKIDYALTPIIITQKFLTAIIENPSIKTQFCNLVNNCPPEEEILLQENGDAILQEDSYNILL